MQIQPRPAGPPPIAARARNNLLLTALMLLPLIRAISE